ncbi:hypothetical protein CHGG_10397 [Chaetomium globosum CBS 148.51]|uniref:Protein kinase domain-containing protein n=1 Tax=Chaetomium globosum (strain ATCC 6205 / CBS 148.51 / DSM 1962 / NBRC 6347 / NRRL 1970) TaxID=306901 RepID=Q2GNQ7_CHAGB|nr:uncharacterized protein CHGG_10397 [Chaetomium globosum CBS 148.51]EAQ83993.1 hypothetical protein CHGG_10397 [Chaetomium globosum CBS 148.51]
MTVAHDLTRRGSTQVINGMALEDKFEVLKEIGDGSFGSVVLARVRSAGASVARRGTVIAIKTMKKTFDSFTACMELREVVFLRTLPIHPHLVPALDIFLDPFSKKLHICMEYMEGNLYQLMKARDHKCLDNGSVKSILFQIMQGLEHIHAHSFFHRDIKPENILVSTSAHSDYTNSFRRYSALVTPPSTPPTYTVKIADFGLARETHSKLPYTTYVSTRWYRAPEVLLRAGEYSAPVDIWAVGAMAVEVATLKPLFPGGNEVDQVWRHPRSLGRKQSDVSRGKDSVTSTPTSSKPSWFRKSLIGRTESVEAISVVPQPVLKETPAARPSPIITSEPPAPKPRAPPQKRTTWANGPSNVAPINILPTIRPISPLSDAVTAQANNRAHYDANGIRVAPVDEKGSKKIGRQLSVQSTTNHYAEIHRQQAERALNGNSGLASPTSGHKESFFSHLRKRARRFSGRHQTPISPAYDDLEAQAGCGPWGSNRSSMVMDSPPPAPVPKDTYDSLDKKLQVSDIPPAPPAHQVTSTTTLKRHHSLPHHQPRSVDNLVGTTRGTNPVSSRTRRAHAVHDVNQYDAPDEEEELLDEVLTSTHRAMKRLERNDPVRQAVGALGMADPYPTPSPSASGNVMLFGDGKEAITPKPLNFHKPAAEHKWPTPPYDEGDWAASASASIWAAGNRF